MHIFTKYHNKRCWLQRNTIKYQIITFKHIDILHNERNMGKFVYSTDNVKYTNNDTRIKEKYNEWTENVMFYNT